MPEGRTYVRWEDAFVKEYMKICKDNDTQWGYVEMFSQRISKLLRDRTFDVEAENIMINRFYNPLTGFKGMEKKMKDWRSVLSTIHGICIRPDGSLFYCPRNITTEKRLLNTQQDSELLLLSILFLYEGMYKGMVNFIYGLTGHGKYKDHRTNDQAEYLFKAGLDLRVLDKELRNNIAHMTFQVTMEGDVFTNSSAPLPPDLDKVSGEIPFNAKRYERGQLIAIHDRSQAALSDLFHVTQYWFYYNHGPHRLFDDEFFESPEGNGIREAAIREMIKKPSVVHWNRVMENAREKLRDVAGKPA